MQSGHYPRFGRLHAGIQVLLCAFALVAPGLPAAAAERESGAWRIEPGLDVRMVTYHRQLQDRSTTYPALGTHLSLELSAPGHPLAAGWFADYELAAGSGPADARLFGGWVRWRFGAWELSTTRARLDRSHSGGLWLQANKLQYTLRPGHKLALEAIGPVGGGTPALQLAYTTDLSRRLTLRLDLGIGRRRMQDMGAMTKFVWTLY